MDLLVHCNLDERGTSPFEFDDIRRFLTWKADQPPFPLTSTSDYDTFTKSRLNESFVRDDPSKLRTTKKKVSVSLRDFHMIKVIGKGSFGKVVLVQHKQSTKLFAMKVLSKTNVIKRKQVEHTRTERRVLGYTRHPFIVGLRYAFQTPERLFFILDYCPGGELFYHLTRMKKLPESMARFYAAEIILALEHLHGLGVIYRDLKPENLLLDRQGHIKLADFGLAKEGITECSRGASSLCGTPEYLPPEILDRLGHGTAVDWWNLGMVLYEMLTGLPPWYTKDRVKLFNRLRTARLHFPPSVSRTAQHLIKGLLCRNPNLRLGSQNGATEVKAHPFFASIDWSLLYQKKVPPALQPCGKNDATTSKAAKNKQVMQSPEEGIEAYNMSTLNFENEFTRLPLPRTETFDWELSKTNTSPSSAALKADLFCGFSYENTSALLETFSKDEFRFV